MIKVLKVEYSENEKVRKRMKNQWVTSVEASRIMRLDTKKLRKLCKNSLIYHALAVDISGTVKYWFERKNIYHMARETNQIIRTS